MVWQYTPYTIFMVFGAIISGAIAAYAWRRRAAAGAPAFFALTWAVALWSLAYAFELSSANLSAAIFWANIEYIGIVCVPVFWFIFAVQYTHRGQWLSKRNLILLAIVPAITLLFKWTNPWHGFMWADVALDTGGSFTALDTSYGWWFWVYLAYSYILLLAGTILIVRMLLRSSHLYRKQIALLLTGAVIPWIGNAISIFGLSPIPNLDLTPLVFVVSGILIAWGLFQFKLLDITPVARQTVIDSMQDGMLALDLQGRIVVINPAALRLLEQDASNIIGARGQDVFAQWHDLVSLFQDITAGQTEIMVPGAGGARYYFDIRFSPLRDRRDRLVGRLIILRDITAYKQQSFELSTLLETVQQEIADRKQAEKSLQESEEQLRQVFGSISDHVYVSELIPSGENINHFFSPTMVLTGYPKEKFQADWEFWISLIHLNDRLAAATQYQRLTEGQDSEVEYRLLRADGEVIWVRDSARAEMNPNGNIMAYGVVSDITQRKKAEQELRILSRAVEQSASSIIITNFDGDIEYVNPRFTELSGYLLHEVIGKNPRILKSGKTSPENYAKLWATILGGNEWRGEIQNKKKNGEPYWISASISPVKSESGAITHFLGVQEDITEQKQVAAERRTVYEQQQILNAILRIGLENIPLDQQLEKIVGQIITIPWMSLTAKGGIFLVEDEPDVLVLKAQKGLAPSLLTSCAHIKFGQCLCGRAALSRQIQHADCLDPRHEINYDGIIEHGHYNVPILSGEKVLGVIVLYLPEGHQNVEAETAFLRIVAGSIASIIERKRAEEALDRAKDEALSASRLKTQLLANISHDLRTPLGAILGYTEMLQVGFYGELTEKQQNVTTQVMESTEQLLNFINNLMGQAQIETGKIVLNARTFSLADLLDSIRSTVKVVAQAKGLKFTTQISPDMPATITCDHYWLRQILVNLVSNAVKFTDRGEVAVFIYPVDAGHWAMQVTDTGCGIPPEAQDYIFEPFKQVDGTASREQHTGSGLGLSIVKHLVELMDGNITLSSTVGQESTFTVILPFGMASK